MQSVYGGDSENPGALREWEAREGGAAFRLTEHRPPFLPAIAPLASWSLKMISAPGSTGMGTAGGGAGQCVLTPITFCCDLHNPYSPTRSIANLHC